MKVNTIKHTWRHTRNSFLTGDMLNISTHHMSATAGSVYLHICGKFLPSQLTHFARELSVQIVAPSDYCKLVAQATPIKYFVKFPIVRPTQFFTRINKKVAESLLFSLGAFLPLCFALYFFNQLRAMETKR